MEVAWRLQGHDELDSSDDAASAEDEDDDFMAAYRQKRLQELAASSQLYAHSAFIELAPLSLIYLLEKSARRLSLVGSSTTRFFKRKL